MPNDRPRYGPFIASVGAAALALSVFLPWYALSFTARGLALAQAGLDRVSAAYGNAALASKIGALDASLDGYAGRELATASAHQALHTISVLLLLAAASAFVLSMLRLASAELPVQGSGAVAALGALATLLVLYRIAVPPEPPYHAFALSLRGGAWLALVSSVAIVVGALWSRSPAVSAPALDRGDSFAPAPPSAPLAPPAPATAQPLAADRAPSPAPIGATVGSAPLGSTVYVQRSAVRQDLDGSGFVDAAAPCQAQPDAVHVVAVTIAPEGLFVTVPRAHEEPTESPFGARPSWRPATVSIA